MKEIVVLSGKGGTGKTSLTGAFAALAHKAVLADCDVDAADLHLLLRPERREEKAFHSGRLARIDPGRCTACGACVDACHFGAIGWREANGQGEVAEIDPLACEGCGLCALVCPEQAVESSERRCGEYYLSDTRFGPLVHARLDIAAENSGKLVTRVRERARELAAERDADWLIVDGPPGIGCPVIAALTGADAVVAVTEPSLSGLHDLERVGRLVRHFGLPLGLCINKYDINPELAGKMEAWAEREGFVKLGRIPWDPAVTRAQVEGLSLMEYVERPLADRIERIWSRTCRIL